MPAGLFSNPQFGAHNEEKRPILQIFDSFIIFFYCQTLIEDVLTGLTRYKKDACPLYVQPFESSKAAEESANLKSYIHIYF